MNVCDANELMRSVGVSLVALMVIVLPIAMIWHDVAREKLQHRLLERMREHELALLDRGIAMEQQTTGQED